MFMMSVVSTVVIWESGQWLGKNIVWSTSQKNSRKAWTGALAASIILLKTVLNTIQSIEDVNTKFVLRGSGFTPTVIITTTLEILLRNEGEERI